MTARSRALLLLAFLLLPGLALAQAVIPPNPTPSGLSGTNTGDVTLGAFGSSPDAKGATLSGQVITIQPADATHPGAVTTGAQTIAGAKTFTTAPQAPAYRKTTDYQGVTFTGGATFLGYGSGGALRLTDENGNTKIAVYGTQVVFSNGLILSNASSSGTSYSQLAADGVVFMTNAAARTVAMVAGSGLGSGAIFTVVDASGSANATHTITITPASGTIDGASNAVITPGTNRTKTFVSDGTNWWTLTSL